MFGKNLKAARKKLGLTLDQLADNYNKRFDAKLTKGTLSKYENNKQEPMITVVGHLSKLLDVSVDFLINGTENNQSSSLEKSTSPILKKYNLLNETGQQKTDEYVDILLENPKYTKNSGPLYNFGEIAAWGADGTEGTFETPEEEIT